TPLLYACESGNSEQEIVNYLIEQGANIKIENKKGDTPLSYACKSGKQEVVKYLVKQGADIN
ncbi:hypothetical protein PIROE2DRAFT_29407, partial [Piromyces sp. E2]